MRNTTPMFTKFTIKLLEVRKMLRHGNTWGNTKAIAFTSINPDCQMLIVVVQEDLTHLAFEVDSLEEFGRHLAKLGFEYSDGPTMREAGGGFAFIDAPEGYEIELIEIAK